MRILTFQTYIIVAALGLAPGHCIEPITGIAGGVAVAVASLVFTGYKGLICYYKSCCNDRWIVGNITGLKHELMLKLHGQHLVQKTVAGHLQGHLRLKNPAKALVLSFHGQTGVGKNLVSNMIAASVYKEGIHSPYVHFISATKDFPHAQLVSLYKDQLKSWIEGNVTLCERSMFIFDEIDKLPATLLDVIKPYADHYEQIGGVDYRKSIFIFLSNTGGTAVAEVVFNRWKFGANRESLQLHEVENTVMSAAINADNHNGFWHSQLISSQLITAYIPFLPLEKSHVRKCIIDALIQRKYYTDDAEIDPALVDTVMKELTFFPPTEQVYSTTGCKRVVEKVDYVMLNR